MAQILEQIGLWIEQIITALGYPGIAFVMFTENVFPPIPSELVMPFAGFLVGRGELNFVATVVAGVLGSVLGAVVLYYLGVWADERLVRRIVRRYGRILMLSEKDLDRALEFFGRYGEAVIFFGRLIPTIRSLISIPAGMNRMPLPKFLFFTALGSTIWTGVLAYAGVVLGENWENVLAIVKQYERLTLVVLVVVFVIIVVWLFNRWRTSGQPAVIAEESVSDQ
jgi:membrane protein DedA with SNARE-associated domain